MKLSPSAHVDTFCRDHLPPAEQWPEFRFDLPELNYPDRLNCGEELLEGSVASHGADRPALRTTTESWSYRELIQRANQVARVLTEDFGVVPGNRVLLRGPNNPWLVAAWFGVLRAGAVAVTSMPLLRAAEVATLVDITQPMLAICDHRFDADVSAAKLDIPTMTYGGVGADDLITRAAAKPTEFTPVPTAADDVALLAPTSGTTGRPKATVHFHRDVMACTDTFARYLLKPHRDDVFTGTPPLGFTFGLGGLVLFPLRFGACGLLLERPTVDDVADSVAEHGVNVLFTSPTMYRALLSGGTADRLRGLRRCVSAGEHLPASVWEEFHRATGIRIIDGIGATEMIHIFVSAADDDVRPGSTGKPVPGYQATILDRGGDPVAVGTPGLLAVKGPTGCRYLSDDRQLTYVRDGWNLTGDTYIQDSEGYFWYQARSDDMIVSAGYNIAGPEVERALVAHPDVVDVAVVGVPNKERGAIVKAYVILAQDIEATPEKTRELQEFVKQEIAPYKYPRAIEYVTELPRTESGKLQRYRLRQEATAQLTNLTEPAGPVRPL